MGYTVKKLADLAGVSPRTLRYYDQVGLLKPSAVRANGYREYDQRAALQLQQILFYRELGLELKEIERIMFEPGFDLIAALRSHRRALQHKARRLNTLLGTIDKTIKHLEGEREMSADDLFDGFMEKQKEYENEVIAEFGADDARYKQSIKRWNRYSKEEQKKLVADGKVFMSSLAAKLAEQGAAGKEVQAMIAQMHASVNEFWECDLLAFSALCDWYLTKPEFVKTYQGYHPDMPELLNQAIKHYVKAQQAKQKSPRIRGLLFTSLRALCGQLRDPCSSRSWRTPGGAYALRHSWSR